MGEQATINDGEIRTSDGCWSCGSTEVGARFCTQCGAPAAGLESLNQSSPVRDDEHGAVPAIAGVNAFAGAQRAAGYIEDPHTIHGTELREIRVLSEAHDQADQAKTVDQPQSTDNQADQPRNLALTTPVTVQSPDAFAPPSRPVDLLASLDHELNVGGDLEMPAVARRGLRGALGRFGIRVAPGKLEQAELDAAAAQRDHERMIRQATWTRAVSVLVANRKGGVGKTPVSLLLGGVLAAARGGSVAIVEVSDDPGALAFRAEGNPPRGIGELVRDVDTIRTAGQLAGYTAPQTSFASVIGSTAARARLTHNDVTHVAEVVDEYYALRVMDSGNQPSSSAFQGALETTDALVIPVLNAGDAVLEAIALLDELRAAGGKAAELASAAIIVRLTDGRPEHHQVIERINQIIDAANVRAVFDVPYDAHIAERGQLTLDKLQPATLRAFTAIAANVVEHLQRTVR